ncbi:uncharacterized protein LOC9647755 [Selaginella moellendorffii]|uniref:uncharacterized protein LOC9647755 n=1 Tax=Selaginella moellendorffii TaxID=88036 RepID=UPI000D1CDBA4|nr:uncharacterized protein LOC9647755 [Selaginella moellendorffii]|eukprot:XP_024542167.1 uncharacterized protein LOC9647755 [Selaginella moellendorffii]
METETNGDRRWKTILLVDSEEITVPFVLWNDQVPIANLLNDGSMLALERPFVNCDTMEISLESGTCTRIDCVPPCLQLEQEVTVASDHETCLGSEVLIPRNPHGAVDLNHFPARFMVQQRLLVVRFHLPSNHLYCLLTTTRELSRLSFSSCWRAGLLARFIPDNLCLYPALLLIQILVEG